MARLIYTANMANNINLPPEKSAHVEDRCEHPGCTEPGHLGYQAGKNAPRRTWCADHYPYWREGEHTPRSASPPDKS